MVLVMRPVITGNSSGVREIWNDDGARKGVRCGVRIACWIFFFFFFWGGGSEWVWCYSLGCKEENVKGFLPYENCTVPQPIAHVPSRHPIMRKIHGFVNISPQGDAIHFLPGILVLLPAVRGCIVSSRRVWCGGLRGGRKAFEDCFEHRVSRDSTTCLDLVARGEEKWGVALWQKRRVREWEGAERRELGAALLKLKQQSTGSLVA